MRLASNSHIRSTAAAKPEVAPARLRISLVVPMGKCRSLLAAARRQEPLGTGHQHERENDYAVDAAAIQLD